MRRIVELAHVEVTEQLTVNRERLDSLASALLEHETLDGADAYAAAGMASAGGEAGGALAGAATARLRSDDPR